MNYKKWIFGLVSVSTIVLILSSLLFEPFVRSKIEDEIGELRARNVNIQYEKLTIHLLTRDVRFNGLQVDYHHFTSLSASLVHLRGFHIFEFLLKHRLHFKTITFEDPTILKWKDDQPGSTKNDDESRHALIVDHVNIFNGAFIHYDPVSTDTVTLRATLRLTDLSIHPHEDNFFSVGSIETDSIFLETPFYIFHSRRAFINSHHELSLDSIQIQPRYPHTAFAVRHDIETDQFSGMVYTIRSRKINFNSGDTLSFSTGKLQTQFNLSVFRDKRFKDDTRYKPLPVEILQELPWKVQVDTIVLLASRIEYHEHVDKPDTLIHIWFDNLKAQLTNVSNKGSLSMAAAARFMNAGTLIVNCKFEGEGKRAYIEGSLLRFPLNRINGLLGPMANITFSKGEIVRLKFNFWFNNDRSDGIVELSYRGLKVATFNEKKKKKDIISMLINTILKKNDGQYVTGDVNTGTIQFYRDKKRGIFPFWWKSLLTGVKSSFAGKKNSLFSTK